MSDTSAPSEPITQPPTVSGVFTGMKGDLLVLDVPGTDYELHLLPAEGFSAEVGDKVAGTVRAQARRMDVIEAGGRYIEPVYGRPRRVQGRVVGGRVADNEVYVKAGPILAITPLPPQRAADFAVGQLVTFDVEPGASFTPV